MQTAQYIVATNDCAITSCPHIFQVFELQLLGRGIEFQQLVVVAQTVLDHVDDRERVLALVEVVAKALFEPVIGVGQIDVVVPDLRISYVS